MRKLTLKEMQSVVRGVAAPSGAGYCGPYGCYPNPTPTPRPTPRPCHPNPGAGIYC